MNLSLAFGKDIAEKYEEMSKLQYELSKKNFVITRRKRKNGEICGYWDGLMFYGLLSGAKIFFGFDLTREVITQIEAQGFNDKEFYIQANEVKVEMVEQNAESKH
jgi:hypothetical protein